MSKKTIRNTIILSLAAIVLVVATVLTTLAYMTSSAAVANTFSVGDVSISMYETKTDDMGIPQETGKKTASGNHYTLIPGHNYTKDPTIYINELSEKSYLFIKVRNDIAKIEEKHKTEYPTIATQLETNGWKKHHETMTDIVYVYAPNGTVGYIGNDECDPVNVFQQFTIEHEATQETLKLYNAARVSITAYAIQDSNNFGTFGSDAAVSAAWDAIVATYDYVPDYGNTTNPSTPVEE